MFDDTWRRSADPAAGQSGAGPDPVDTAATSEDPAAKPRVSNWQRWAWILGLAILVVVSIHGIREFLSGDAQAIATMWDRALGVVSWVLAFAVIDVAIETVSWMLVFQRFGLRGFNPLGAAVAVSGKAGLLMPAQLGRLVRPSLMVRLGRGTLGDNLKAEAALFLVDAASVVALFTALVAWLAHPALAPLAGSAVVIACLYMAHKVFPLLRGTALAFPRGFWWNWRTFLVVALQAAGWVAHGFGFWAVATALDGSVKAWDAVFLAPGSAVLGIFSGLPGGLGVTELLLGASLDFKGVPESQLALGVGMFRVLTFWIWVPIGWLALGAVAWVARSRGRRRQAEAA